MTSSNVRAVRLRQPEYYIATVEQIVLESSTKDSNHQNTTAYRLDRWVAMNGVFNRRTDGKTQKNNMRQAAVKLAIQHPTR